MDKDLVSIIMPAYKSEKYIKKTIESVLNQTYKKWELLIVDDCSKDGLKRIIDNFNDTRIRFFSNKENSGAAISRNYALREAKGKWIAFLDSDDLWLPTKLEEQLNFMQKNNYKFSFTDYRIKLTNGEWSPYIYIGPDIVDKKLMYRYCYFSTITVMYDQEYVGLIQIEDVKKNNDYALWLKIIEKSNAYRYPKTLSIYCKRENSISSGNKIKLIKHHYILFRKAQRFSLLKAFGYTVRNLFFGIIKKKKYKIRWEE